MRLSEAIRIGSKLNPPTAHGWTARNKSGQVETCALVAGVVGAGHCRTTDASAGAKMLEPIDAKELGLQYDQRTGCLITNALSFPDAWMPLLCTKADYPCECVPFTGDVYGIVMHLHDKHQWSREAAANWIESVENKMEAARVNNTSQTVEAVESAEAEVDSPASVHSST